MVLALLIMVILGTAGFALMTRAARLAETERRNQANWEQAEQKELWWRLMDGEQ